jgi:hypothetical protein
MRVPRDISEAPLHDGRVTNSLQHTVLGWRKTDPFARMRAARSQRASEACHCNITGYGGCGDRASSNAWLCSTATSPPG